MSLTRASLLTLFLVGCGSLEKQKSADLQDVAAQAPAQWTTALPKLSQGNNTGWVAQFSSAQLNTWVDKAMTGNPDLRLAAARVREAQAQARAAGAALLPQATLDAGANRAQRPSGTRFASLDSRANRFETNLNVSWEADVWGRLRAQRSASLSEAQAQQDDEHAARLSLAASVVNAAITLTEATLQTELAEENVTAQRTQLQVLEKQLARGINAGQGTLDVSLSRADLARAEATVQTRRRETDASRRALESLLGDYPAGQIKALSALPTISASVPAGIPSDVLLRRPDIRAAERRLAAAVSSEKVAQMAFLPAIRLTGGTGFSTAELNTLLQHESLLWSIASSVAQAVFQGGRLKANVDAARARYDQALQVYAQAALKAFTEVETALAAEQYWAAQENALRQATDEANKAEQLARSSYQRGLSDILTLLDSRRRAYDAATTHLTTQAARLKNRVTLQLALGGTAR
jgi:outer membrane protein, multidrug efflux system